MSGIFITMEGPDGAGKSTQIQLLADYLRGLGFEVVLTREPGGTPLAEKIRDLVLALSEEPVAPMAEVLLYAAGRAQHVENLIKPALARGAVVISDRFVDSSVAYQGFGRDLGADLVWEVNKPALGGILPHLTILLDLDPTKGRQRLAERELEQRTGLDRLEQENLDFHNKVRQGFLVLAKEYPERIRLIGAASDVDKIHQEVISLINHVLPKTSTVDKNR